MTLKILRIFFKKLTGFVIRPFLSEKTYYDGCVLPGRHLRFGGRHFRTNAGFLNSACKEAERLVSKCNLNQNSCTLEIGCGPGRLAIGILKSVGEIKQYSAIDVNKTSVEWCNKYIQEKHPTFNFIHLDVANPRYNKNGKLEQDSISLPFEDRTFDIIYLYSVFSHLVTKDVETYCSEFARLLKPHGKVFLTAFVEKNVPDITVNPEDYQGRWWHGALHCVRYNMDFVEKIFNNNRLNIDHFEHAKETDGQSAYYLSKAPDEN